MTPTVLSKNRHHVLSVYNYKNKVCYFDLPQTASYRPSRLFSALVSALAVNKTSEASMIVELALFAFAVAYSKG